MKYALMVAMLIAGYALGNILPVRNVLFPEKRVVFEADYVVKSGTFATTRYLDSSITPLPVEILFGGDQTDFPKLKFAPAGGQ